MAADVLSTGETIDEIEEKLIGHEIKDIPTLLSDETQRALESGKAIAAIGAFTHTILAIALRGLEGTEELSERVSKRLSPSPHSLERPWVLHDLIFPDLWPPEVQEEMRRFYESLERSEVEWGEPRTEEYTQPDGTRVQATVRELLRKPIDREDPPEEENHD